MLGWVEIVGRWMYKMRQLVAFTPHPPASLFFTKRIECSVYVRVRLPSFFTEILSSVLHVPARCFEAPKNGPYKVHGAVPALHATKIQYLPSASENIFFFRQVPYYQSSKNVRVYFDVGGRSFPVSTTRPKKYAIKRHQSWNMSAFVGRPKQYFTSSHVFCLSGEQFE